MSLLKLLGIDKYTVRLKEWINKRIDTKITDLVNSAPETLNTLGELATAIQENEDIVNALDSAITNKADQTVVDEISDSIAEINTTLQNKADKSDIKVDWNAQKGEAGYIENKPFGVGFNSVEWFYDDTASWCITPMMSNRVKYEGVIYEIPDDYDEPVSLGDGSIALAKYYSNTNELIYVSCYGIQDSTDERLQNILFEVNTKLDEKYIPDTIARKADVVSMINVTHAELMNLRDNGELISGMQYRITDYMATTAQENTRSAGHQFDVIVTADNKNTLNEVARACRSEFNIEKYKDAFCESWGEKMLYVGTQEYEGKEYHLYESESRDLQMLVDFNQIKAHYNHQSAPYPYHCYPSFARGHDGSIWEDWQLGTYYGEPILFKYDTPTYFATSRLEAWQIWYSLDNDTERFAWANNKVDYTIHVPVSDYTRIYLRDLVPEDASIPDTLIFTWWDNPRNGPDGYGYDVYKATNFQEYGEDNLMIAFTCGTIPQSGVEFNETIFTPNGAELPGNYFYLNGMPTDIIIDTLPTVINKNIGKGVIYRMIDEWNNDCPYDFKNIQFKRGIYADGEGIAKEEGDEDYEVFCYTFSWEDETHLVIKDASIFGNNGSLLNDEGQISGVYGNAIKSYITYTGEFESPNVAQQHLNNIVFLSTFGYEGGVFYGCYGNSFGNNCHHNSFGNFCYSNSFGNDCYSNSFGNDCYSNSFVNSCRYNSFGNSCGYNSFIGPCSDTTLDSGSQFKTASTNSNGEVKVFNLADLVES